MSELNLIKGLAQHPIDALDLSGRKKEIKSIVWPLRNVTLKNTFNKAIDMVNGDVTIIG